MKKQSKFEKKKSKEVSHGKEKEEEVDESVLEQSAPVEDAAPEEVVEEEAPIEDVKPESAQSAYQQYIAESRKVLEHPLPANQRFFETPDGEILVGELDKTQAWSHRMNGGKGGWANPRR